MIEIFVHRFSLCYAQLKLDEILSPELGSQNQSLSLSNYLEVIISKKFYEKSYVSK